MQYLALRRHQMPLAGQGMSNGYWGWITKQSSDLTPEPDLQEHQRLILRASKESTEHRARRPVVDAISAPTWQLMLVGTGAVALFLVAVVALFVALL